MDRKIKIAFGGGCHWCTEAVFLSLKGVVKVEQGYISSIETHASFSEGIIVHYHANEISLKTLIEIHILTHKSSSNHSMRKKYRSAIYTFSDAQQKVAQLLLDALQIEFKKEFITKVLPFSEFKASREAIQNYYQKNPNKPFCERYIHPKLQLLRNSHSKYLSI